jgi:hypothetical protein
MVRHYRQDGERTHTIERAETSILSHQAHALHRSIELLSCSPAILWRDLAEIYVHGDSIGRRSPIAVLTWDAMSAQAVCNPTVRVGGARS